MERDESQDREEIRALIERIHRAWVHLPPDQIENALDGCFTDDVVFFVEADDRDPQDVVHGAREAARSYADFARNARILSFDCDAPAIEFPPGRPATATVPWRIGYVMQDVEQHDVGADALWLARGEDGRWRVSARTIMTGVEGAPGDENPQDDEVTR